MSKVHQTTIPFKPLGDSVIVQGVQRSQVTAIIQEVEAKYDFVVVAIGPDVGDKVALGDKVLAHPRAGHVPFDIKGARYIRLTAGEIIGVLIDEPESLIIT